MSEKTQKVEIDTSKMNKIRVLSPLLTEKAALVEAAKILPLPPESERQPDLQYITAIFVSSGMNKNGAVFLGSELVKAAASIKDKAVDVEHVEREIIGQITGSAYVTKEGRPLDLAVVKRELSYEDMDILDMDVAISAIVHKARFPELSDEIFGGQWMVSMEAFYRDYDVKVGDLIIPRAQAEELGYDKLIGSVVRLRDGNKEKGYHLVGRILRDIIFSGVGIVKNPANERSVIMEAAAMNEFVNSNRETAAIVNLADIKVLEAETSSSAKETDLEPLLRKVLKEELAELFQEGADRRYAKTLPGTCVSYQRYIVKVPGPGDDTLPEPATDTSQYPLFSNPGGVDSYPPGSKVVGEHHCNLFDLECTARPGDATMPACWRNVLARTVREELTEREDIIRDIRGRRLDLVKLQSLIDDARKFSS
jgi:hypothetical protein